MKNCCVERRAKHRRTIALCHPRLFRSADGRDAKCRGGCGGQEGETHYAHAFTGHRRPGYYVPRVHLSNRGIAGVLAASTAAS